MCKNVLILSRGFRAGDAITTLNLFSKWSNEHLYCASLVDSEYITGLKDFYLIGNKEITYFFPFNYILKPFASKIGTTYTDRKEKENVSLMKCVYERLGRPILQWLDQYETRLRIDISDEFDKWITEINPQIIYTSIGDIAMAEFIIKLHAKYPNIKFVIHGFDDWMSPTYKVWNETIHRRKAEQLFKRILSFSSVRFTSSEMMTKDYAVKYGYDFVCFPNPVKISDQVAKVSKRTNKNNVVFTGKISWHNNHAIKEMMLAVEMINMKGQDLTFDIYTDSSKSQLESFISKIPVSTVIHEPVPNNQIPDILANASILYLPINIDKQTAKFAKYSMSTKMGEYLSSGVPVIYYGPEGMAMTEFLKENDCAHIISEHNLDKLQQVIIDCLKSKNNTKIKVGKRLSSTYFNINSITSKFKDNLVKIL